MTVLNVAKFFTAAKDLDATAGGVSGNVIYTCPPNFVSLIRYIHVSNGSSNNKKFSLQWYDASTTTYHLFVDEHALSSNSIVEIIQGGGYLALEPGDKIIGFEEASSDFHVIVSGEEHFQPA